MKKQNGITLVALIITIIVLLILATVSISLVINSGIITKTKSAVDKYSEEEIGEQIKLAYLECETEKMYNSNVNEEEYLTNSLKKTLNDENLTAKVKNGKLTVNTTLKGEPKTYIYKLTTGESYEYKDPFDYGGKAKKDLVPGDDITLGTEKFRVFYNQGGVIKAMPFYNLKLDSNPIRQAIQEEAQNEQEGKRTFSSSVYWEKGVDNINMDDSKNNIQQYIIAYKIVLEKLGANIDVRAGRRSELNANGVTPDMRNPGKLGNIWLGSGGAGNILDVQFVYNYGSVSATTYNNGNSGVRPIIIIEY